VRFYPAAVVYGGGTGFCRKALPHYLLIFQCRHREMYYYFVHLLRFHFLS
jgi:hypothetical protein